ncbi:transcriptional antiterminator NusG [Entomoplasma freundtii]|uniref:Transcription termination/antitermination protein NusG n=1 Tax=Entomoplasma freundtii TaxID=74700 RepID=A0A2K8NS67_9MOLU|nr:transcription termination/antitermination protein NusG [Entomoplasma freundtii]ATZ16695.1 transcription termination/antitermination protein NusG [Entomoplasma freundtii]TDY58138.1 transcriptional antiterminator NusG [Entomoplasma freundtii]
MKKNEEMNVDLDMLLDMPGQWFVINCSTGHEEKVLADLQQKIKTSNLENDVFDLRISKGITETKSGKIVIKNRFPGYIFINMNMSDKAWFVIRNTPGVTGFIGSAGKGLKPFPLTMNEVIKMLSTPDDELNENGTPKVGLIPSESEDNQDVVDEGNDKEESPTSTTSKGKPKGLVVPKKELHKANFNLNDFVRIKEGPYQNEEGKVIDIDYSKGIAIVSLEIFGRYTPAEVAFTNLEPVREY